jgi:hypothetical protein
MRYKWFWLTLMMWFALSGLSTWALIYSPLQFFPKKINQIDVEVNGLMQKYELYEITNSLEDCLAKTISLWEKEGWTCRTGNINFANMLLGSKTDYSLTSAYLHISLFQKNDLFRILGLCRDQNKARTYQCTAEIPKKCFEAKPNEAHWHFPLKPPSDAFQPCFACFSGFQVAIWFQPASRNLENRFIELFSSQGYVGKPWAKNGDETVYLIRRENIRLLAMFKSGREKDMVSLLSLNKD